jgi:hypothetical protein
MPICKAGRTKHRNAGTNEMEVSEPMNKLFENPEGKCQFVTAALGPFEVHMFAGWNDRFFLVHKKMQPGVLLLLHNLNGTLHAATDQ